MPDEEKGELKPGDCLTCSSSELQVSSSPPSPTSAPEEKFYNNDFTAYAVVINYIIGAGVLGVPYAFYEAGLTLTLITFAFFAVFLVLAGIWVIEIMSRARGYEAAIAGGGPSPSNPPVYSYEFGRCSFTQFCGLWAGLPGKLFAQVVIICLSYGALWAYVATFASSLSLLIFKYGVRTQECDIYKSDISMACQGTYYACAIGFGIIVTGLTLLDITEAQIMQMALTVYRFVALGLMFITAAIALGKAGPQEKDESSSSVDDDDSSPSLWSLKWAGFGYMFPSAALALNVHFNLGDALSPMQNKRRSPWVAAAAQLTALAFYIAVGAVCAVYFNPPRPLVTLNWSSYTGRDGGWGDGSAHWWATVLKLVIILFPVIDLTNVYPLIAISLAGNLAAALPKKIAKRRVVVRLIAALPPLILGTFIGKLNIIFTITGLFGFFIEFVIPTVFQWLGRRKCVQNWGKGSDITPYTGWHSGPILVWLTFTIGVAAFLFSVLATACPQCLG